MGDLRTNERRQLKVTLLKYDKRLEILATEISCPCLGFQGARRQTASHTPTHTHTRMHTFALGDSVIFIQ